MTSGALRDRLIWIAFAVAVVLATAPVWRPLVFGIHPTFDELLQLSICGGRLN